VWAIKLITYAFVLHARWSSICVTQLQEIFDAIWNEVYRMWKKWRGLNNLEAIYSSLCVSNPRILNNSNNIEYVTKSFISAALTLAEMIHGFMIYLSTKFFGTVKHCCSDSSVVWTVNNAVLPIEVDNRHLISLHVFRPSFRRH
jgi:hypothetical protein